MKKNITFIFLFSILFGFCQQKRIDFTKQFVYESNPKNDEKNKFAENFSIKLLGNTAGEFLIFSNLRTFPMQFFTDGLGTSMVSIGLNNKLNNSNFMSYFLGMEMDEEKKTLSIEKLNTKETILGFSCNNYLLGFDAEESDKKLKVCIDETSNYSNVSVLTGLFNFMGRQSVVLPTIKPKGLVLKVGGNDDDKDFIVLKSINESKDFVYFNHGEAMVQQQKTLDSLAIVRKKMEEEYEKEYGDLDSMAVEADSAYIGSYYGIEKYESTYKTPPEEPNFAIDNMPSEKLWEGLPSHCRNIDKELPSLENKTFQSHLRNLTGQMCDMYLTQDRSHNVAVKITIDDIRREILYMNENKEKLNKSDQRKVNKYLEKLD